MFTFADHMWAVCAYGDSPYLEECIQSLIHQEVRSNILISTSTPSVYIQSVADKYEIPVYTHSGGGIGSDWNAAYDTADTAIVTIAHQDDLYEPEYTKTLLDEINRSVDPIIFFSEYYELRDTVKTDSVKNLRIKRFMLFPLRGRLFRNNIWVRRRILSLGSAICCPSVSYVKSQVGNSPFSTQMKVSLDWDQWEKQSKKRGAFVYSPKRLMCHRIHAESETTRLIENSVRSLEDMEMFRRFWPEPIAQLLEKKYAESEKGNDLNTQKF